MPAQNPGWMYHKNRPEGQLYPDLTGIKDQLEKEGWVDTPAKLPGGARAPGGLNGAGVTVTQAPPAPATSGEGRTLGADPIVEPVRSPRVSLLIDLDTGEMIANRDGDYVTDDNLGRIIDDMSREELTDVATYLGIIVDGEHYANTIRMQIALAIRPDMIEHGDGGPLHLETGETDEVKEDDEKGTTDHDGNGEMGGAKANPDASDEVTPEALNAMDAEGREAWILNATKAVLQAQITARGQTFKVRDGKEELQEQVRAALPAID